MSSGQCETMEDAPRACQFLVEDSNEAQHARELLVMEEEARIRRQNLMKRINFEHCVQQKERQALIEKISNDIRNVEKRVQSEIFCVQLDIRNLEARTEIIDDNTVNRTAHLQQCHDNQVDRLKEYMARLETKRADIAFRRPEVIKELNELENPKTTDSEVEIGKLEDQLKRARNQARQVRRFCFDEEENLKMDVRNIVNMDDIENMEEDLRHLQQDARNLRYNEDEELASINYDLLHLKRKIQAVQGEGIEDEEEKLHKDIASMNTDLEDEEQTLANMKTERNDMKVHFTTKMTNKLQAQEKRIKVTRKDLDARMAKAMEMLKKADDEGKKIPGNLDNQIKEKKLQLEERKKIIDNRRNIIEQKFKNDVIALEGNQGDQLNQLKERLVDLNKQEKQMEKRFEKTKDQIEKSIDTVTNGIPDILDAIDKVDKQFLDELSNRHGDLGKTEMINKMVKQTNLSGVNQIGAEVENLDGLLAKRKQDDNRDIARMEDELQEMLNKHRAVQTDFEFIDRKVRIATRDLRNDTNHCKYKMRCLRAIIRDQNTVLANLDGSTARTEHEMEEMIKRSAVAHEEEKVRLEKLLEDEHNSQVLGCNQLEEAIKHASGKHDIMIKNHRELRDGLIQKLSEKQKIIDTKFDLEQEINKMGKKIQDLDSKMSALADKHGITLQEVEKLHAQYKNSLEGKKAVQLFRVEQQKKLNGQVAHMETTLDSVNRGLEAVNHEAVIADTEEAEDLKRRLAGLQHRNNLLTFKLRQLGKHKDQNTNLITYLQSSEHTPSLQLIKLQGLHSSLKGELGTLRHELKKARENFQDNSEVSSNSTHGNI